jgi:hypothetical protein
MTILHRTVAAALFACVLGRPLVAMAEPGHPKGAPEAAASDAAAAAPARAGSWIQVDPQTGKRMPGGRPVNAVLAADPAFSTSHSGLVEEAAPGGGMMIDLHGRFRSAATATVGADGQADVECLPPGTAGQR